MKILVIAASLAVTAILPAASRAADSPAVHKTIVPEAPADKDAGFTSIFDGKTLRGWDGDPAYWRAENGELIGELKTDALVPGTFIIWRGGKLQDFELKLEERISDGGDSGVYYRTADHPKYKWAVSGGYQNPIEGTLQMKGAPQKPGSAEFAALMDRSSPGWSQTMRFTGGSHGGKRYMFQALPGQLTQIVDGESPRILGTLDNAAKINDILGNGWVQMHMIVKDNMMIHITNGHVTSVVIDEDEKNRFLEGLLALHAHPGTPMKVEFRNIRLKTLAP